MTTPTPPGPPAAPSWPASGGYAPSPYTASPLPTPAPRRGVAWGWVILVGFVCALFGAGAMAFAMFLFFGAGDDTSQADAAAPVPTADVRPSYEVGACVDIDAIVEGAPAAADCTPSARSGEVAWNGTLSVPEGTKYPSTDALSELSWASCLIPYERYVGTAYWDSEFDVVGIVPSRSAWDKGERFVTCVVTDPDGVAGGGTIRGVTGI